MAKKTPWYVNVLLGPIPAIFEKSTGRSAVANKEESADEYVRTRLPTMENYKGGKGGFDTIMSQQADACAAYVKGKGILVGGNNAREVCVAKVKAAYAPLIMSFEETAFIEEQQIKDEFAGGDTTIYIIAAVAIIIILYLNYNK